jgi:threonine synthase
VRYISTRGQAPVLNFTDVVLTGLASDGGLYVPEQMPQFNRQEIASWTGLSYQELAFKVIAPFIVDDDNHKSEVSVDDLKSIIHKSYQGFRHKAVAPLVQIGHNEWILELFQGPTLAFKDFALQFLGHLLDHILNKRQQKAVVMGATSGDTGSAAIEGCRRCNNLDIFILHPHQRVSDVQRRQMTTVLANNVHNIALEGNFDDCQNMVKASFSDQSFLPDGRQLVAVNSINWARILAQIVYYFYAALALGGPHRPISFSVPTGNFGDVFAGYLAKKMGLPIDRLIVATNSNDILHRCISSNDHSKRELIHSLSPSMDIMVSSNFERLLFDVYERKGNTIQQLMADVKSGTMKLSNQAITSIRSHFDSCRVDDDEMIRMTADVYQQTGYLLDPHTAIGVKAARAISHSEAVPRVCLATAHPAKFPEAVRKAGQTQDPPLPHHMADLFDRQERYQVLPNNIGVVQKCIKDGIEDSMKDNL